MQSEATINGIIWMMSVIPAAFLGAAIVALFFYNISEKLLRQIEADLRARKSGPDSEED